MSHNYKGLFPVGLIYLLGNSGFGVISLNSIIKSDDPAPVFPNITETFTYLPGNLPRDLPWPEFPQ